MNILHINDLHIQEPRGKQEALRNAFYPEYFETLLVRVSQEHDSIDHIFITGDIVHHAKETNYPHAEAIINYLSKKLLVPSENIYIANGNHDIDRKTGSMDAFNSFTAKFAGGKNLIASTERYCFYKKNEDGILCLNSIGPNYATGTPSPLSIEEKDHIVELVRTNNIDNIFVLSHHPPESYSVQNQAPFDEDKPDWSEKHIWPDGGNLHRRLASKSTVKGVAFWFAGDIHRPEHCIVNKNRLLIVTGSVNALEDNSDSDIPPQVRVISSEDIKHSCLYEYSFVGHRRKGLEGRWDCKKIDAHFFDNLPQNNNDIPDKSDSSTDKQLTTTTLNGSHESEAKLTLIDSELDKDIHKEVVEKKLYEFGRFETNQSITSLSWISIHKLVESHAIFIKIINAFKEKVTSVIPASISSKHCLLVGVDTWGSILASRLGAATNIRSCCVAVKSHSDSYDSVERVNDELKKIVKGKKIVFVISDVISTGTSISTIRQDLGCSECENWYNLTIFCDPSQDRNNCYLGYKETLYVCGSIKMPIIVSSKLPELEILSANISFI